MRYKVLDSNNLIMAAYLYKRKHYTNIVMARKFHLKLGRLIVGYNFQILRREHETSCTKYRDLNSE